MTVVVRAHEATRAKLKQLSEQMGKPIAEVLAASVSAFEREQLIDQSNAAFAALRADTDAWDEELAERREWDATLRDGVQD
jgi:primosomal protein N''